MNKKYKVGLIVVTILLVSTIFIGTSYSLWSSINTQSSENLVETTCFDIEFSESSNISMSNAYPMSDKKGLTGTPYTFTITNTCDMDSSLNIAINPLTSTTMSLGAIKTSIKSIGNYSTPKLLTDLKENSNYDSSKYKGSFIIYTDTLYVGETKEYSILMWMDENATNKEMGTTFSSKIVVTNVADNKLNNDYVLAAFIDGQETNTFPSKNDGYVFDHVECSDSNVVTKWDNNLWGITISNVTQKTKCSVFFNALYKDGVIASIPELYDGLIAVKYDEAGNVIVADTFKEWYDYSKHNWANAVLVNRDLNKTYSVGSTIPMDDILQMYVWIPRYRYQLWNTNNESSNPQAINIVFEKTSTTKSTGSSNGEWLTHPAFTFGSTELNGIWVGKFENSNGTLTNSNDLTNIIIKPNVISMVNVSVSNMFNAVRNIELQYSSRYGLNESLVDTHMMKNMEWGAVAYLTNSVYGRYNNSDTCIDSGCEVWINNTHTGTGCVVNDNYSLAACGGTVTGCSGASVSAGQDNNRTTCQSGYDWTTLGVNASTTGNMYGLYDMSGGAWEYVMGNMVNSSGGFYSSSAGFSTAPDSKYYDSYAYSASTHTDHNRGKLGDATRETLANFGSTTGGWYNDYAYLPSGTASWFQRGGGYYSGTGVGAGVFYFARYDGYADAAYSFRSVLAAE